MRAAVNKTIAEIASWSISIATSGIAPSVGFGGEQFPEKSDRALKAGTTLAKGWRNLAIGLVILYFPMVLSIQVACAMILC